MTSADADVGLSGLTVVLALRKAWDPAMEKAAPTKKNKAVVRSWVKE